jgi:hypothetical protein
VIQDEAPGGILAKILHNVRTWPLAARVAAVAIPILIAFAFSCTYQVILPADHLFRSVMPIISLVTPFLGMYEGTSLVKEFMNQLAYDYRPGAIS